MESYPKSQHITYNILSQASFLPFTLFSFKLTIKPAPLLVPMKGKKVKMSTQSFLGQSSNKKKSKLPIKMMKNLVRIVTSPLQQPVHRLNYPCKLISSDDEDAVASHHQQQVSKEEEGNDSEAEEMAENQDMDLQRLGKRKRSSTACGLTSSKLVKYLLFSRPYFAFDKIHRNFSALKNTTNLHCITFLNLFIYGPMCKALYSMALQLKGSLSCLLRTRRTTLRMIVTVRQRNLRQQSEY